MAETTENLYQILAKIRSQVNVMQKDGQGYNYNYVKEESILAKITGLMDKFEISLIPCIMPATTSVEPYSYTKMRGGKQETVSEILVSAETEWTWVNNQNPKEKIVVSWVMVGQQSDASQAFGAGLTYCTRYFLLKFFNIATSKDDPDKLRSEQKQTVANADRTVAAALVEEAHKKISHFVPLQEGNREIIKTLATKFVKDGNYFTIADPLLAQGFLEEVQGLTKTEADASVST